MQSGAVEKKAEKVSGTNGTPSFPRSLVRGELKGTGIKSESELTPVPFVSTRTAPKRSSHCWRIGRQSNWLEWVNQAETEKELESLRKSVQRGRPFGGPVWQKQIAKRLGLESAYRPIGRPRKVAQRDVADSP